MRHGPDPLIGVRELFRRTLGYRSRHKLSVRVGGVVRVDYARPNEPYPWELTFLPEEAPLIAAWVAAGATGPLPLSLVEYTESHWRSNYRWTGRAWLKARAATVFRRRPDA